MSLLTIQKKIDLLTVLVENMTVKAVLIEVARIEKKDGVVKKLLSTILVDAEKNQKIADRFIAAFRDQRKYFIQQT